MEAAEQKPDLDQAEQVARIMRAIEETSKFNAEQRKLSAEALKFERERSLAPLALFSGLMGGAIAATIAHFLH